MWRMAHVTLSFFLGIIRFRSLLLPDGSGGLATKETANVWRHVEGPTPGNYIQYYKTVLADIFGQDQVSIMVRWIYLRVLRYFTKSMMYSRPNWKFASESASQARALEWPKGHFGLKFDAWGFFEACFQRFNCMTQLTPKWSLEVCRALQLNSRSSS